MGYQERDFEVVDYELFRLRGTRLLRGPEPTSLEPGEYFSCLGAAQTFGCFCQKPFPALLGDQLGSYGLNIGLAGAGPRLFLEKPRHLHYVNEGRFAIVQVMSGRSEDNSRFDTGGREHLRRRSDGQLIGSAPAYRELLETESVDTVKAIVEETRENWIRSYAALLEAISVPTILFWFSRRAPDYQEEYTDVWSMFGEFPQLVNRQMVERVRELSDAYVECTSSRGHPHRLISRFTGEPTTITYRTDLGDGTFDDVETEFDTYYPSPEMHEDAAAALLDTCRAYMPEHSDMRG